MARRTVDFPAPLGPTRQVIRPAATSRSRPRSTSPCPYPATTPRSCSAASTSVSEIRVEDGRVVLDGERVPARDRVTAIQHDHRVAEPHHEAHLVLDDEERHALSSPGT